MLRRVYNLAALLALLNLLGLGGGVAYLVSKGYLTEPKIRRIGEVMRGEDDPAGALPPGPADAAPPTGTRTPSGMEANGTASQALADPNVVPEDLGRELEYAQEIAQREMGRFKDEMDQRMALNNRIMLQITTRREALERDQKALQASRQRDVETLDNEGFKKELEIFETLKSSVAMERLLAKSNIEDAARLVLGMDSRKVAKIIESAKNPADQQKLQAILDRIREASPDRVEGLTSGP